MDQIAEDTKKRKFGEEEFEEVEGERVVSSSSSALHPAPHLSDTNSIVLVYLFSP